MFEDEVRLYREQNRPTMRRFLIDVDSRRIFREPYIFEEISHCVESALAFRNEVASARRELVGNGPYDAVLSNIKHAAEDFLRSDPSASNFNAVDTRLEAFRRAVAREIDAIGQFDKQLDVEAIVVRIDTLRE